MSVDITALFCCLDDFCKLLDECEQHRLIPSETTRQRAGKLSRAKMLFIVDHGNDTGRNVIQGGEVSVAEAAAVVNQPPSARP